MHLTIQYLASFSDQNDTVSGFDPYYGDYYSTPKRKQMFLMAKNMDEVKEIIKRNFPGAERLKIKRA